MAGFLALGSNPVIDFITFHLKHTPWQGLRYYDLIWPCFMLMVGMSVPFSYAKRSQTQSRRQMTLHALQRFVILFLLGSLRTSVHLEHPTLIELSSALQPIAVAYLVAFFLAQETLRFQSAVVGLILAVYAILLEFVPAPGVVPGSYEKGINLVYAVDMAVLGRAHSEGWGTVLSTIPTVATTLLGLILGGIMRSDRSPERKMLIIGGTGIGGVVLGLALDPFIPVVMKLWTTSYGILTAGWACLLFVLFYWIIDVRGYKKWAFPFVVIGMNAIAIYMSRTLIPLTATVRIFTGSLTGVLGSSTQLFTAVCVLAVEILILWWMYERRIFIRA
jgi:predicted acyltransferase